MYASPITASPRPSMEPMQVAPNSSIPTFLAGMADAANAGPLSSSNSAARSYTASDVPRNEDDITQYVLYDGLPHSGPSVRHARELQSQAYLHFTHRICERQEAAHSVVISANPLSLSVMASQLRMYRWKVSEAQTLLEATSLLQDFVIDTSKHGFRVRRRPAAPLGQSRYAWGRGRQELWRIAQAERAKLEDGAGRHLVATTTTSSPIAAPNNRARTKPADSNNTAAADTASPISRSPTTATAAAAPLHGKGEEVGPPEAEEVYEEHEEDRLPLPPPDALPRLILVDSFTHEDFADIARHIRFLDNEHGLELLLVLLLPTDPEATAAATQGAGCVVTPQHETTMEEAYKAGYDLVLAHSMDNLLVEFLTSAFVSSVGRWRNDVRSKAAVGNYMSVRNVLLGGLDVASLQQLVWDDKTDDAEVLELLGAQSLSVQGDAKRYGEVSRQLLVQQQQQSQLQRQQRQQQRTGSSSGRSLGSSGDEMDGDEDDDGADRKLKRVASAMMSNVPRLRYRPASVARFGVRLPANQQNSQVQLSNFGQSNDVLGVMMGSRSGASSESGRRRRHKDGDGTDENEETIDEDADDLGEDHRMLRCALENEMGRLLAENEGKQGAIEEQQREIETLRRTVAILKRHLSRGGRGSSTGAEMDSFNSPSNSERPASGSMMHLSKQQQIYILKERLEAVNDQIGALLKDGRGGEQPSNARRGRTRGGTHRGGRGGSSARGAGLGGTLPPHAARRYGPSASRRHPYEDYQAAREAEMMAMLDDDAYYMNATLAQMVQASDDNESSESGSFSTNRPTSAFMQRREREATDRVLHALQEELHFLRGRLDDATEVEDENNNSDQLNVQARMTAHLQAAVERLEAERQRVRHLEELRQTDRLLLNHATRLSEHMKSQLSASKRALNAQRNGSADKNNEDDNDGEDDNSGSGTVRRSRRAGKSSYRTPTQKSGAGVDFGEEKVEKERADGPRKRGTVGNTGAGPTDGASSSVAKGKGKRGVSESESHQPEEIEDLISAAVTDAVAASNRAFRRQLGALVDTCKSLLTRIVLKHQKPRTITYVQLLKEELEQARRGQRDALMRLQFTLSHLRPDQYNVADIISRNEASGSGADAMDGRQIIPLRAVKDAEVRRSVEQVAREHAAYALRAAYMSSELQRVQKPQETLPATGGGGAGSLSPSLTTALGKKDEGGDSSVSPCRQLLLACHSAKAKVKEAIDNVSPLQSYLDAVQAEMEAEQRLSAWCEVDCAQLFRSLAATTSSSSTLAGNYTTPHLALVPTKLSQGRPSSPSSTELGTPSSTEESGMPHCLADVDGSMKDVVDVYATMLRSFVSLGEGWSFESNNKQHSKDVSTSGGGPSRRAAVRRTPQAKLNRNKALKKGPPSKVNHEKSVESISDELDVVDELEEDLSRPLSAAAKEVDSFRQALAQLPTAPSEVSQYLGQLGQLYTAEAPPSQAQRRLYEICLRAYQQRCINPLHMATLETTVLPTRQARSPVSGVSLTASSTSSPQQPPSSATLIAAHAQHREVLALLQLMAPTVTPALRSLTEQVQQVQQLLEDEMEADYLHNSVVNVNVDAAYTSVAFLSAVDAALLSCVVDELRWRQWRRAIMAAAAAETSTTNGGAPPPVSERSMQAMLREALVAARKEKTPASLLLPPISDLDELAVPEDRRMEAYYTAFCEARAGASTGLLGNALSSNTSNSNAEDFFGLDDLPRAPPSCAEAYNLLASLQPNLNAAVTSARTAGGNSDDAEAGRTVARDLAEFFSKRRAASNKKGDTTAAEAETAEAAFLADIYLDQNSSGGGLFGEGGGDNTNDANMQAIRRLRMELEYMEALKKQRMEKLAMLCEWRLRGRPPGGAAGGGNEEGGPDGADTFTYPPIDPERLNFTVKSGTSAWYGMEAAKRVRTILRRRARPDQIIVGGGPGGSDVGIELSRRTAQPAVAPPLSKPSVRVGAAIEAVATKTRGKEGEQSSVVEDENGYQVEDEGGDYRGQRYERKESLPPLSSSPQQHHRTQLNRGATQFSSTALPPLRPGGRLSRTQPQDMQRDYDGIVLQSLPYMSPRDAVSLNAYANLASGCHSKDQWNDDAYVRDAVEELSNRVLAYRAELMRAAGRLSPSTTSTYANGAPYCLPIANPLTASTSNIHPRPPLPQQTSWVYGVPPTAASAIVQLQTSLDPRQPRDTMLFMPPRARSSIAEVEERGRAAAAVQRELTARFTSSSSPAPQQQAMNGLAYSTPAAMAAQRLQTMLTASMADPSVGGGPDVTSLAALRMHQLVEQQRQKQEHEQDPAASSST